MPRSAAVVLALLALPAVAGGPSAEAFVSDWLKAADARDARTMVAACRPDFRDRSSLSCSTLAEVIAEGATVKPGRQVLSGSEALVELWLTERSGSRFPIVLLAEKTRDGWQFVDGTDADGPTLPTKLSLEGVEDPGAPTLPTEIEGLFTQLNRKKPKIDGYCAASLSRSDREDYAQQASELTFRATEVQTTPAVLSITTMVLRDGRPVDEVWLRFAREDGVWKLTGIDEDGPLPDTPTQARGQEEGRFANQAACLAYVERHNATPCLDLSRLVPENVCPAMLDDTPMDFTGYYGCLAGGIACTDGAPDLSGQADCHSPQFPKSTSPTDGGVAKNVTACRAYVEKQNALPCMAAIQLDPVQVCPKELGDVPTDLTGLYDCMRDGARCDGDLPDLADQAACRP